MLRAQSNESVSSQALDTAQLTIAARQKAIVVHSVLNLIECSFMVCLVLTDVAQIDFAQTIEGLNYRAC